ncbi:hypothetical protein OsJ_07382 [Oryza sativa Japonica Group]|uniref:Ubiquitin-like domain-containing protein n=1 Tax=Oryza sativa subsp. japonica TaxID=39947 RepID=A3A8P0_ORYSJ|nr:hypothetical protein OsJ_07382 [Oryza sativa Japonica Group]
MAMRWPPAAAAAARGDRVGGEAGRDAGAEEGGERRRGGDLGELKVRLSMVTGLEPREQRLLFRGKEREDTDHLHMVGVRDKDKVLLLEDPALKDMKVRAALAAARVMQSPCQPFIQV